MLCLQNCHVFLSAKFIESDDNRFEYFLSLLLPQSSLLLFLLGVFYDSLINLLKLYSYLSPLPILRFLK